MDAPDERDAPGRGDAATRDAPGRGDAATRDAATRDAPRGDALHDPLPARVEGWLHELGLDVRERAERDGISSWDLLLDGRRRRDIPVTLILDPTMALLCWVQYAPPLRGVFRLSYRKMLRWNDELPFVKFAISADDRPLLIAELPVDRLDRELLGLTLARLVTVCDLLLEGSVDWLWPGARHAPVVTRPSRHEVLLERHAASLAELEAAVAAMPGDDLRGA